MIPMTSKISLRKASRSLAELAFLATVFGGLACGTPPKPPELEAFEKLRASPAVSAAAKRNPDLVKNADRLLVRAQKEWKDNDLEDARNAALMGQIKLKHALALSEQEEARRRIAAAESQTRKGEEEHARLQRDLAAVNEQVALLTKLQEAADERQRLAQQLTVEQQKASEERLKAGASDRISDAELAIKTADTVNAATHAKAQYGAATDNLARAKQEFQKAQYQAAQTSAEMARVKAHEAVAVAKPLYEQEAQAAENRARAEALARDAAAIPNVTVRREARGSLQRLVIPLQSDRLFTRRETTIPAGRDATIEPIANLMKKYASYPVQIVGYTDNRGKTGELLALSLARAQSVFSALVLRGVEAKRMVVSGQGGAEPVSDNRTVAGRAQNNRIEIVFLYQ
jgi:outer membrane protein OmpA-like peptidoglycan-associated protein